MAHRSFPSALVPFVTGNSISPYLVDDEFETLDGADVVLPRSAGRWQGILALAACGKSDEE